MTMNGKLRWRIADLLNRLPGQCWSSLVNWALHDQKDDPDWRSHYIPWSPIDDMCREDARRCGSCYCGKIVADEHGAVSLRPKVTTP